MLCRAILIIFTLYIIQEGATALNLASELGHKEIVGLLLDRGADVDKIDTVLISLAQEVSPCNIIYKTCNQHAINTDIND